MTQEKDNSSPEIEYERWSREIRRGALTLAILATILDGESYGYNIMKRLSQEEYTALHVEPSTTYPLLRRLEKRGILEGYWSETSGKRRRLYNITKEGREILQKMVKSWLNLNKRLSHLLEEAELK